MTRESYDTVRIKLIKRLRIIRDSLRKLQISAINYHKANANKPFFSKIIRNVYHELGMSYPQIDIITEEPTEEEIDSYEIESAHIRAKAHYQYRLKSRIGQAHLQRVKYELWAKKRQIYQSHHTTSASASGMSMTTPTPTGIGSSGSSSNGTTLASDLVAYVDYLMNIFTLPEYHPNEIHSRDLHLILQNYFYLNITENDLNQIILPILDPKNTGYIHKEELCTWLFTGQHLQYSHFFTKLKYSSMNISSLLGIKDAKLKILCDMRRIIRNEINSQKYSLKVIDTLLEIEENSSSSISSTIKNKKKLNLKIKLLQEESEIFNEELKNLKLLFDKQEQRVLSRISENDAEEIAKQKIIFTNEGRYYLFMEILLMKIAKEMISTYGEIIPITSSFPRTQHHPHPHPHPPSTHPQPLPSTENEQAFKHCLSLLINCFDTDCSGTFDESEITLLLKCVQCPLPEKKILFYFPDVILDSCSLSQVISYLLPRVKWSRAWIKNFHIFKDLEISTRSFVVSSSLLLISSARQSAREKSDQAAELINTGILLNNENNNNDKEITTTPITEGLLVRCQLLAMRQVTEFLKTPYGYIRQLAIQRELLGLWEHVVTDKFSKVSLIRYLFSIFQIDGTGYTSYPYRLLNSELPHIIRFAAVRYHWTLKPNTCQTLATLYKFTEETDARWIMFDELLNLLDSVFDNSTQQLPSRFIKKYILSDSQKRMESIARQQAILIAINYPDKNVKETNYRCFILGLLRCVELLKSSQFHSEDHQVDWENIPFEGMLLYLLAQGFTYHDLLNTKSPFYQSEDIIDYTHHVNPEELLSCAMNEIFSQLDCKNSMYRIGRYLVGFQYFHLYSKIVRLIQYHQQEINIFGRMFLNEIMTGVSHCTFDN